MKGLYWLNLDGLTELGVEKAKALGEMKDLNGLYLNSLTSLGVPQAQALEKIKDLEDLGLEWFDYAWCYKRRPWER